MNKYLLSVDIEGISGVVNKDFANKNGRYYQLGCRYMTSDVNAVVRGILCADVDAWITVRDAHGADAVNLDLEKLHPQASLIQGWGGLQNMLGGLDQTFKGVFLVGYHAGGQNSKGVLGHTLHSLIHYVKINGQLVNETGIAAFYAGCYDVPVVFVSGDDYAVAEAQKQLGEVVGVAVKQSFARDSIIALSLEQTQTLLETSAAEAVTKLQKNKFSVFKATTPITFEVAFYNTGYRVSVFQKLAEILAFDSTYKFTAGEFMVTFCAADALEALQRLNMLLFLVYGITS